MRIHRQNGSKRTPLETVRAQCLHCCGGNSAEVATCDADDTHPGYHVCLFHKHRMGKGRISVKAIKKFCVQCMSGKLDVKPSIMKLVRECTTISCYCYPYREGHNPSMVGRGLRFAQKSSL
jgi:hypothetical protein